MFRAIYLNSPFLKWGHTGLVENVVLRGTPFMMDSLKLPSTLVLRRGGEFDTWRARIHTQHAYDVYKDHSYQTAHTTLGFAAASQRVFNKLHTTHERKGLVTTVSVCMITVLNDDIIDSAETIERTSWIGPPDRIQNLIMDYGSHDVFLSPLVQDVTMALDHIDRFLCRQMT